MRHKDPHPSRSTLRFPVLPILFLARRLRPLMLRLLACSLVLVCAAIAQGPPATHTQVVVLGTGTPEPYPDRAGASVAIVQNGIKALNVKNLKIVFITHLHSDHTLGYPDLIFSPWVLHRRAPLQAYGPR